MAGALDMCQLSLPGELARRLETRDMATAVDIMERTGGHLWRGVHVAAGGARIGGRRTIVPAVVGVRVVRELALMSHDLWPPSVMTVAGARNAAGGMTAASRGVAVAAGHGDDLW
jgi:hypothetical protein